jgi:hypothetical protein
MRLSKGVRGGTRSGVGLCGRCKYGQVLRGEAESHELTWCFKGWAERLPVPWKVVECSGFLDKTVPEVNDLEKVAQVLVMDRQGKIGFVDPKKFRQLKDAEQVPETPSQRFGSDPG